MHVRTERTTTHGETVVETYEGDSLVWPPNTTPQLGNKVVLGRVTDITDIGGGAVTFENADGDIKTFGEVEALRRPPMVNKFQLEFEAIPDQTFTLGRLIGIEHGNT